MKSRKRIRRRYTGSDRRVARGRIRMKRIKGPVRPKETGNPWVDALNYQQWEMQLQFHKNMARCLWRRNEPT